VNAPRIGISGRIAQVEGAARTGVNSAYAHAVARTGGVPLIFPPIGGATHAPALLDAVDALLLSGGADIDPAHYHTAPHAALGTVEPERDALELALFREARARRLPVLAICRGLQLTNVALGGTLWQDLPTERAPHPQSTRRQERAHEVTVTAGSRLAEALGTERLGVNSFHHQAIRDLAPGLAAVAHATDGVIEGIESTEDWWLLGVQWHPEEFWAEEGAPDLRLFEALVAAAAGVRA
jgi:putative glutamine amidotransferase